MLVRAWLVLFSFLQHGGLNVKLRTLEYFTLYLRNRQSGNLRTIENCICGLCSIERNMRSFLRTVCVHLLPGNFPLYGISSPTFSQGGIPSSLLSLQQIMLNPFLFIKNKPLFTVYPPLKKRRDMFSEGNAARLAGCDRQPSADDNESLTHFFLI
jgi:hypothetical protein